MYRKPRFWRNFTPFGNNLPKSVAMTQNNLRPGYGVKTHLLRHPPMSRPPIPFPSGCNRRRANDPVSSSVLCLPSGVVGLTLVVSPCATTRRTPKPRPPAPVPQLPNIADVVARTNGGVVNIQSVSEDGEPRLAVASALMPKAKSSPTFTSSGMPSKLAVPFWLSPRTVVS